MITFHRSKKRIRFPRMCFRILQDSGNHSGLIFCRDGSVAASAEWSEPGSLTDHGGTIEYRRGIRKQSKSRCINRLKKYPSIRLRTESSIKS